MDNYNELDDLSLEAALLPYPIYVRRYTLFRTSHLASPLLYDKSTIELPKQSTYHFVDMSGLKAGPEYIDPILTSVPGIKSIVHVQQLIKPEGQPIRIPGVNPSLLLTTYRRHNRMIRPTQDPSRQERDERGVLIYNYSILPMTWRYASNFRSNYLRWVNIYRTIFANLNDVASKSNRHQFLNFDLPARIPSLGKLREYSRSKSSNVLKYLNMEGDFLVADLYRWFGDEPGDSVFSLIDEKNYRKVNLIVGCKNTFVIINLGWLNDFSEKMKGRARQYRLLLLFNKILDKAQSLSADTVDEKVVEEKVDRRITVDDINDEEEDVPVEELDDISAALTGGYTSDDSDAGLLDSEEEEKAAEKELEELERIREEANAEVINDDDQIETRIEGNMLVIQDDRPAIIQKADELLRSNNITPAAHKRLVNAQKVFDTLPDPFNPNRLLKDALTVSEEDYTVEEKHLTNDEVVLDPKMRISRVDSFQQKYIKHALRPDVLACITAIQKFPVAITSYEVVDKSDAMTEVEEHVFRVVPAVGSPSTLRIPVLKLAEDGTFKYLGKRYRSRPQRADCPIRKIGPAEVVLSSYAGKVFVERSSRAKFNYPKWMGEFLMAEAVNAESETIVEPNISTVVNYGVRLPYTYTVISNTLADFKNRGIFYNFDYNKRVDKLKLTEEELKLEKDGGVIVAKTPKGIILLDMSDEMILVDDKGLERPLGNFETLFEISNRVPLPIADVKLFGKEIPAGMALAYLIGLDNLLKLLRVNYRLVNTGERLNLTEDEYAIRFKNESMVFDKNDRRTSLIMSGFVRFERHIRVYDRALFNEKDVYTVVLEKGGIAARYLRELDAYNVGFIDPITEDLLKQMNEPIEFIGLIIRAVELILDEHVPARLSDPKGNIELPERVRGYERIPGTIYESLFKAMRQYAARATRSDAKVVINPTEAMSWITMDPTTSIVNNINPIHSLREREVITFGGRYGRSKKAMVARTRLYTPEDKGFISEASVDSGDIGVITYLTPNANITTVRGTVRLYDRKRDGDSSLLSTSVQLMPSADGDDQVWVRLVG